MRANQIRKARIAASAFAASLLLISGTATADVKYEYTGRNFDTFSNPTSYRNSDRVTATVRLTSPLPPNLVLQDIRALPGFSLTMSDGQQTLTPTSAGYTEAIVSTDSTGQIVGPWSVFINCCNYPNNFITALNYPNVRGIADQGALSHPTGLFPNIPTDLAQRIGLPGSWSDAIAVPNTPVTWELKGHITGETGASVRSFFPSAIVGDPFRVLVTFDSNARLVSTDTGGAFAPGMRYRYDPASMAVSITVGAEGPVELSHAAMPSATDLLYVMDNSGFASFGVPWDGIFFGLNYPSFVLTLGMRGSILDIVRGPGLPSTPDPRLVSLEQRFFQMGPLTGGIGSIRGQIESVGVFVADTDGDGIADTVDNCPALKNPDQKDRDGDGKGDVCDTDLDGDGVPNSIDNCPAIANASQVDSNGDGYGDACVSPLTTIPQKAYVDPTAQIGPNVTINQGAIISGDVVIGAGTVVGRDVVIQAGAMIGASVRLEQGVLIASGVTIGDGAQIGSYAALCRSVDVGSSAIVSSQSMIGAEQEIAAGQRLKNQTRLEGTEDDSFRACVLAGPGNFVEFSGAYKVREVEAHAIAQSTIPKRDNQRDFVRAVRYVSLSFEPWADPQLQAIANATTVSAQAAGTALVYQGVEFQLNELRLDVRSHARSDITILAGDPGASAGVSGSASAGFGTEFKVSAGVSRGYTLDLSYNCADRNTLPENAYLSLNLLGDTDNDGRWEGVVYAHVDCTIVTGTKHWEGGLPPGRYRLEAAGAAFAVSDVTRPPEEMERSQQVIFKVLPSPP